MTIEEAIRIIKIVLAIAEDFEITVQGEELTKEKCKEAIEIVTKILEQQPITWIVGNDNCQVAVRNMPIDKMQKICTIIGE